MELVYIFYMAIMATASGGSIPVGFLDKLKLTWLPELLFAFGFGFASYQYGGWIACVLATTWSYLWMQTGHGVVLPWGRSLPVEEATRRQTLSPLVDWIARRLGIDYAVVKGDKVGYSVQYCRLFMAVKGFLIGLPVGGVILAILWPLAYEIGVRLKNHTVSELLSGTFAGLSIVTLLLIIG